ncbi:uncharacterized protein LOC128262525 [Drosophila gunungcola]|uniref:uncharacterized protein LOC128262525 n=1 Tax=Drosophila gunungcola TaxID=103775 RepID=UPI0022DED16A|nr:uncharacterized protein LOC128262525 [Drosophila gunungcola]
MGEKSFRKLGLGVILTALVLYALLFMDTQIYEAGGKIHNAFFVNTDGCRIIAMDVMNPTIAKYTDWEWEDKRFYLECNHQTWFRTEVANGRWYLKLTRDIDKILEENDLTHDWQIECFWFRLKIIKRWHAQLSHRTRFHLEFPYALKVPKGLREMRVRCINTNTNRSLNEDAFFFIQPPPEKLLKKAPRTLKYWKEENNSSNDSTPPISVMILGLDSVSHLNLLRQMPKTVQYMRNNMSQVEFWGFNKIGNNTYPNLIGLLTGLSATESQKYWLKQNSMDGLPLIWKEFKKAGYNTSFAEDMAIYSMFYYGKPGFKHPTTDHNFQDFMVSMYILRQSSSVADTHCVGERTFIDVLLEMNDRLLPHKQRYPFFSFYWWANGFHEFFNSPRLADGRFERLLRSLDDGGITNNTIILFMSDHGLRWGRFRKSFQGMIEDSQPFLSILYPDWMRNKYPLAMKNLAGNAHSLVTTYDLHETLRHILDLNSLKDEPITQKSEELWKLKGLETPRAVSLFLPIPPWRNCNSSQIPSEFCLCHKQVSVPVNNRVVKKSASIIIEYVNKLLEEYAVCIPLELDSIVSAYFAAPQRDNDFYIEKGHKNSYPEQGPYFDKQKYDDKDIVVRLKTKPGNAYFEGMTRRQGSKLSLIGDVVRVGNDGSKDSDCIENPLLEPYCYCAL